MTVTFNAEGSYNVDGNYTLNWTETIDSAVMSQSQPVSAFLGSTMDGVWRIDGDRFIFTNDAFLGNLLSAPNDISSRLEFELIIVGIDDSQMTFEIGTSIDYTPFAGYPSRLNRTGTVGFDRL